MASNRRGVERVLVKLNKSVEEGRYYEAHQMYRTLYFRYNAQKKYVECIDLLYNGAITLLKHNQHQSGSDLALLLIDILEKSQGEVNGDTIDKLSIIHSMLEKESPDRPMYVSRAIRWSAQKSGESNNRAGHPDLHQRFAHTSWEEQNYTASRYHFVHSHDGEGCATMLVEYHIKMGYPSEADLFIAQAVFQLLCLQNKNTAETAFRCYTEQHPSMEKGPPFVRPLLNFLWLLLLAIEGGKVAVFTILCEQYQPSLGRDPCYNEYLDKIGQLFFGLPPPRTMNHGLFGGLLQSLFGIEDDSDEEEGAVGGHGSSWSTMRTVELD